MIVAFGLLFFEFARLSSAMGAAAMTGRARGAAEIARYIASGRIRVAFAPLAGSLVVVGVRGRALGVRAPTAGRDFSCH